jgi:hypothetical protein
MKDMLYSKTSNGARAPCARFLIFLKITLLSFKKFGTKNIDVDNYEIYNCAKNQSKIYSILGSAKKDKCIDLDLVNSA